MNLLSFLRAPREELARDLRPSQLLTTAGWYFGYMVAAELLLVTLRSIFPFGVSKPIREFPDLPLWLVLLLPPLIEELSFRLPLRRNTATIAVALCSLSFLLVSMGCGGPIYSTRLLPARVGAALLLGGAAALVARKALLRMPFGRFFYLSAFLFGLMHLFNFGPFAFTGTAAAYLLLYVLTKSVSGAILGYARLRHGFGFVVALRLAYNLIPIGLLYLL